jgi:hypothetical protein
LSDSTPASRRAGRTLRIRATRWARGAALAFVGAAAVACQGEEPTADAPAAAAPAATAPATAAAAAAQLRELAPPAADGAMAFQLTTRADGGLLLSWLEPAATEGVQQLRAARLDDSGFGKPMTVVESGQFFANWADVPAVVETTDGLAAAWLEKLGTGKYAYGVAIARSTDAGTTWRRLGWLHRDTSETEHGFVSLAPADDGVRAVWLDGRATAAGKPMSLRAASLRGDVVEDEREVDAAVCDCCNTAALALGEATLVAYRDRTDSEVRDIAVARLGAGEAAAPLPAGLARDGWTIPACPVNGPALAGDGETVALVWYTAEGDRPRVQAAFSSDGGATFSAPVLVDDAAPWGRVGVTLAGDGGAVVSWLAKGSGADDTPPAGGSGHEGHGGAPAERKADSSPAAVRLRHVTVAGAGEPVTVATTGAARSSGVPRLARLGETLYVVWRDDASGRLRVGALPLGAVPRAPQAPPANVVTGG